MNRFFRTLRSVETGAGGLDWLVLTAALLGMAIAAWSAIETSAGGLVTPRDATPREAPAERQTAPGQGVP